MNSGTLRSDALSGFRCPGMMVLAPTASIAVMADGRLVVLLPRHRLPQHQLHAVFPSRRGLAPAVREFLDFLGTELGRT